MDVTITGIPPLSDWGLWAWFRGTHLKIDSPAWDAVPKDKYNPERDKDKGYYEIIRIDADTVRFVINR